MMRGVFVAVVSGAAAIVCSIAACTGDDPVLADLGTDSGSTPDTDSGNRASDSSVPTDSGADSADAAKTFCETQAPLTGVASFFCADFDGTSLTTGWTKSILPDGGGALVTNTDIFHSPPNSLSTINDGQLEWDSVGAAAITEVNVTFQVNVGTLGGVVGDTSGSVQLLELDAGDEQTLTLSYAQGATIQDHPSGYKGYFVSAEDCSNACSLGQGALSQTLPTNVWTQVSLTWSSDGHVHVLYNGISVIDQMFFFPKTTSLATTLGLKRIGASPAIPKHAFDDVVISIRR